LKTAIILVGGEARRAGGKEKYFFSYRGQTFIARLIDTLSGVVDEIIVVARDAEQCSRFAEIDGIRVVQDIRRGIGPIGGLHAGIRYAHGEELFVVACDMPCVHAGVINLLFSLIDEFDAVIPTWNHDMLEPLHAVYRRSAVMAYIESHESLSLRDMIRSLNARYVNVHELQRIDPHLRTFTNINKIEDLHDLHRHLES
jgi:molybdopterin-guanine dinucleotide biosynthesis protein A